MKTYCIIALLLIFLTNGISQTFSTTYGPRDVYLNPKTILDKKIKKLRIMEYQTYKDKKKIVEEYEIIFDNTGVPYKQTFYRNRKVNDLKDTILLNDNGIYDSIAYDKNRNIIRLKRNLGYDSYFKYDSLNRQIYNYNFSFMNMTGRHFNIANFEYDSKSRLIKASGKEGNNYNLDTTNWTHKFSSTFEYDDDKLLKVKRTGEDVRLNSRRTKTIEKNYFEYNFEYKNGVLTRISTAGTNRREGFEIIVEVVD